MATEERKPSDAQLARSHAATLARQAEKESAAADRALKRGDRDAYHVKAKLARALDAGAVALVEKAKALECQST